MLAVIAALMSRRIPVSPEALPYGMRRSVTSTRMTRVPTRDLDNVSQTRHKAKTFCHRCAPPLFVTRTPGPPPDPAQTNSISGFR